MSKPQLLKMHTVKNLIYKIPIFFHNRASEWMDGSSEWMLKNTPVSLTIELTDKNTRPREVKMKTVTHVQKKK